MPDFSKFSIELVLLSVFALTFIWLLVNYFGLFGKVAFYKGDKTNSELKQEPVSIIICARDEADNLSEFLPHILTQKYDADYEVIVVDDGSEDNTSDILREFGEMFLNLKTTSVQNNEQYKHGKKLALMVGLKKAQYQKVLLTDADCNPISENWLSSMAAGFSDKHEIVLGYGPYFKKPGFLNKLIRFDTFTIALQYLAFALKGKPYMGVGRNLAYDKKLFFNNKGFSSHYHIKSGDDDLFINQVATPTNTNVILNPESFTYSNPETKFVFWRDQKHRHLTTAPLYKSKTKNQLAGLIFPVYLFWTLFFVLLFFKTSVLIALGIFLVKLICQLVVYHKAMKQLNEKDLLPYTLLFEFLFLFIYPFLHISKKFVKPNKWKS